MNWLRRLFARPAGARSDASPAPPEAPVADESAETVPATVGPYRVLDLLGEGGMGQVFLVERGDARYALKMLYDADSEDLERFKREIMIGMKLRHPNVCRMVDWGLADSGTLYLVMELLEGEDLENLLVREHTLSLPRVRHFMLEILAGLQAIHAAGVVHRDLKPANVFVTRSGEVKIMDFGIARHEGAANLTATGASLGTPEYISPEQINDTKRVDARSDLFNAGIICYRMVSGCLPFQGETMEEMMVAVM
ncbi:MAG: serine/threonine-protein kinase, partial [Candidatus Xenobia bacterium]